MGKGKNSKNNSDNKMKKREPKIISSVECEKCKDKDVCKDYINYMKVYQKKLVGKGVVCRKYCK